MLAKLRRSQTMPSANLPLPVASTAFSTEMLLRRRPLFVPPQDVK